VVVAPELVETRAEVRAEPRQEPRPEPRQDSRPPRRDEWRDDRRDVNRDGGRDAGRDRREPYRDRRDSAVVGLGDHVPDFILRSFRIATPTVDEPEDEVPANGTEG